MGGEPGSVRVFFGGPEGIDPGSFTVIQPSDPAASSYFGRSVATGDVDGDSFLDLVVGDFGRSDLAGAAYVFYGSSDGIDIATETVLSPGQPYEGCGVSVAAVDLDGDTRAEVVMGCTLDSDQRGAVYVFAGTATGVDVASQRKVAASDGLPQAQFGWSLASAGDTDGDGLTDLLVGALTDDRAGENVGAAYLYSNSPGGACQDADADGACAEDDCDDADPARHPDATEVPGDGIDQDCDGVDATEETDTDTDADTDADSDTDTDTDADPGADDSGDAKDPGGCGCASSPSPVSSGLFLLTVVSALTWGHRRPVRAVPSLPQL